MSRFSGFASIRSIWVVTLCCAMGQAVYPEAPETVAHALGRFHIDLTEAALRQALRNPEKRVRGLAAAELAEMKVKDALPEIESAAEIEADPLTRVNIASAATWMGSEEGLQILKAICVDSSMPVWARVSAAGTVFSKNDHGCFNAVVAMVSSAEEVGDRATALSAASQINFVTKQEQEIVFGLAVNALYDEDAMVRLQACEALRLMNDTSATEPLQKAAAGEQDEDVRQRMRDTSRLLETKHAAASEGAAFKLQR